MQFRYTLIYTVKLRIETSASISTKSWPLACIQHPAFMRDPVYINCLKVFNFLWPMHKVMLIRITIRKKCLMPDTFKWCLADIEKPFLKKTTSKWRHRRCVSNSIVNKTWFPPAYIWDPAGNRDLASISTNYLEPPAFISYPTFMRDPASTRSFTVCVDNFNRHHIKKNMHYDNDEYTA